MAQAASPTPTESVNVSDLLDPVVVPPNKKFPFPVHFFADVTQHLGYKKEKKRIHIPKKGKLKKDRCLLVTAKQIRLCSRTSGSEKYKYPIIDIEGVVLIGNSQLGIFTSEDEKSDLLLELKNSIARGKAIRSIELLRAINSKTETKEFKVWNLLNDSTASDVIRLAGKGIIGRDDYLTPANNSSSCSSIQRDKSFTHRLSSAPSPPPSSYTSGPSGSPPQSPVSVTSTAAASSTRGIVTFSDYGSYEEAVSRCKSLEIVVSELRGEMSGLKAILEHVNHRKEEGILQAARLRQQFEDERTRELVDEVKHLRTVVASVQSENQSLSRRLSEFRHFQSPTLLSRHVSRGTVPSNFNSPTSTLWSSSGYPIDTNNRRLEDEFDRELIKEKRVLHEAKNYYYPNPAPPTPQQDDLT